MREVKEYLKKVKTSTLIRLIIAIIFIFGVIIMIRVNESLKERVYILSGEVWKH